MVIMVIMIEDAGPIRRRGDVRRWSAFVVVGHVGAPSRGLDGSGSSARIDVSGSLAGTEGGLSYRAR